MERHRGRRAAATPQNQSRAEREIKALQKRRLELLDKLEDTVTELAQTISDHMEDGVGTAEIGRWLTSPEKPDGVTRQQVYKLVAERVDKKSMRSPKKPDAAKNGGPRPKRPTRARPRPSR